MARRERVYLLGLTGCFIVSLLCSTVTGVDPSTTIECFVHTAMKHRAVKNGCRPYDINIRGCWGRCDSYQVPELLPPYVYSVHPSCIQDSVTPTTIQLPDCDEGVDSTYVYESANSCKCQSISDVTTAYDYRPDYYLT